jgi:DnaJ-class molecular chaperone
MEKFKQVARAYSILSDTEKRKTYDKYGSLGLVVDEKMNIVKDKCTIL